MCLLENGEGKVGTVKQDSHVFYGYNTQEMSHTVIEEVTKTKVVIKHLKPVVNTLSYLVGAGIPPWPAAAVHPLLELVPDQRFNVSSYHICF
jgi:hypothetical protein